MPERYRRGQFITADGGRATVGKDTSWIRRGAFMTSDPVVRRSRDDAEPRHQFVEHSTASAIAELTRQLRAVRAQIETPQRKR